ncbi:hypothetical protein GH5_02235 [Leishmania sp. Ghana 2012 LV757]|uniref:hypothetical protein n=1 Tax=Leishmania sp. Ghana 2012 LV757 TaxID=2803181 RepID=UPI001B753ADA|nr:hypothetical protein GH5_02235 [Leishmania sp. Ghana 2012 LV757]
MLNGVSDVLTPWTAPRILQIMEATSAFRNASGGAPHSETSTDGAADMDRLLRLANQLPDVAARVMAAPLFAQRPLVELYNGESASITTAASGAPSDGASSMSIAYEDARHMCATALAARRSMWKAEAWSDSEPATIKATPYCSLSHTEPQTAAAELEEVGFAAEFSEPCIRGSFPDAAAALSHVLPEVGGGLSSSSDETDAQSASQRGTPSLLQSALSFLCRPPPVSHAAPLVNDAPSPSGIDGGASTSSLRLHLVQPSPSAASATPQSLVLEAIPPPSLLPIDARGPPGHRVFDGACVAYTFSADEKEELLASLCTEPPPLQVQSKENMAMHCCPEGLRYHQASAPLSAGKVTAAAATARCPHSGFPSTADRGTPGSGVKDDEGWSDSSGWSSRSSSQTRSNTDSDKAKEEAPRHMERADTVNSEAREGSDAASPAVDGPSLEVASGTHSPGTVGTTRTWVDGDDDLVLENGRITVRKKKRRPVEKFPVALSLPTVVSGPLGNLSLATTEVNAAPADERHCTLSAVDGADCADATADGTTVDDVPRGKKRIAGAKRCRGSTTGTAPSDDRTATPSSEPFTTSTAARAATEAKRSIAPAATSSEVAITSTPVDTQRVPRLSQEEMLVFIQGLCVSDILRRALLVGVVAPAVTEATPVHSPGTVGEEQSETDESGGAH